MKEHENPKFFQDENETGGPAFFWENPWNGKKEKIADLFWPSHPKEATDAVEQLFSELCLTMGSHSLVKLPDQYVMETVVSQGSGICDAHEARRIARAVIVFLKTGKMYEEVDR